MRMQRFVMKQDVEPEFVNDLGDYNEFSQGFL
jgi:hypothetical protein